MTFTISQQPDNANIFLYPDGDDTVAFNRNTDTANYKCVDDIWHSPDDDTTYIYTTTSGDVIDKYTLGNSSVTTGDINYVRIITRAKTAEASQKTTEEYKILVDDGTTTGYSSNFAPLPMSYMKQYYTWSQKPSGGDWTWDDINNLKIGVKSYLDQYNPPGSQATFRPNAAGDLSDHTPVGDTENYLCVDEETADDDTTYVEHPGAGTYTDLYNIPNHTADQFGTINSVTIYARIAPHSVDWYACVKTHGTVYEGFLTYDAGSSYKNYSYTWNTNPYTGSNWTWDEIDNLQIGVKSYYNAANVAKCTQVYAVVTYGDTRPKVCVTQIYSVVNYIPPQSSVTLNDPENIEITHSRRIKRFLFGSGDYEVSDFGRSGKTLALRGVETTDATSKMQTIKTMTHYGKYVTITGLPDSNLDGDYYITSFNWEKKEGYTDRINWSLTLEEA